VTGDRPLRVALFASAFAPHRGGVEELVRQLALAQRAAGTANWVATMRWPKSLPAVDEVDGIAVRRYVYRTLEGGPKRKAAAVATNPSTLARVVAELRRQRTDVVHVQCVSTGAWFAAQAAKLLRLPLVVTLQGELTMDATGLYQRSAASRRILRLALRRADAITACSAQTLAEAEGWFGEPFGPRSSVIHNGVDPGELRRAAPHGEPEPYVFAIGRHVPQKGFDILIRAFAQLVERPAFRHQLLLAGDGAERAALEHLCDELGLSARVTFLGGTDRSRTASLFRGADAFVLPSRHEPFGIVNLEAMAAGVPVVATDVGGVPEFVVDGESGLLVPPGDAAAMAQAIARVTDDPSLQSRLAAAGATVADEHAWPAIAAQYDEVYARARS
jgi:glycogen(starch) synthase